MNFKSIFVCTKCPQKAYHSNIWCGLVIIVLCYLLDIESLATEMSTLISCEDMIPLFYFPFSAFQASEQNTRQTLVCGAQH